MKECWEEQQKKRAGGGRRRKNHKVKDKERAREKGLVAKRGRKTEENKK